MKKHLLLILAGSIILSSITMAQPTLTATGINPVAGDNYSIESYSVGIAPGNAGTNQTWVFMPLVGTGTPVIVDSYLPTSTPYGSTFLQTNYSETDGSGYYTYYKTSSLVLRYYGFAGSGYTATYPDPEELMRFPFNMGDSYSDTWTNNHSVGSTETGTSTVTYDGYGTITLPSGTYSNVVRIHISKTWGYSSASYYTDRYNWYINGCHTPIAYTYTTTNTTSPGVTPYESSAILTSGIVTAIKDKDHLSSYITSYPNPAVNEINFELSNVIRVKQLEILDITGKKVYCKEISQSVINTVITIDTSDFKDGIYFAKFELEGGQSFAKKISILK